MKVKTNKLTGAALDWAVAQCEVGAEFIGEIDDPHFYSTDWAKAGPIIEEEKMHIAYNFDEHVWEAGWDCHVSGWGDTPLVAAMRCYVASKLGDEVEVPEEVQS